MEENSGQLDFILEDLKRETQEILHELAEVEEDLLHLQEDIEREDSIDKGKVLSTIKALRERIGIIERIDVKEFDDEKTAENLIEKLRVIMNKCI